MIARLAASAMLVLLCACAGSIGAGSSTLPTDAGAEHASKASGFVLRSIDGYLAVGGKRITIAVNGPCTAQVRAHLQVVGCGVTATQSGDVTKSSLAMYTKPDGKGCLFAQAHYHGRILDGQIIPATYRWVTNSCYKP